MKIVYIFGAGASASIDNSVPVMVNFFEKAIDMLDENNKAFQLAFTFAEKARALPPNPEVENLGVQMGVLGSLLERSNRSKGSEPAENQNCFLREDLTDAINAYKTAFKKDPNRTAANLEDVFSKVESFKEKSFDADNTYDRLQYMINGLFNKLDKDLRDKFSVAAHHDLSQFVVNTDKIEHTFISFNYDLWLEKALFQKKVWHPAAGHGSYRFEYYSEPLEDIRPESGTSVERVSEAIKFTGKHQRSRVSVLKPHGSLSW